MAERTQCPFTGRDGWQEGMEGPLFVGASAAGNIKAEDEVGLTIAYNTAVAKSYHAVKSGEDPHGYKLTPDEKVALRAWAGQHLLDNAPEMAVQRPIQVVISNETGEVLSAGPVEQTSEAIN